MNRAEHARGDLWLSIAGRLAGALGVPLADLVTAAECDACDGRPPEGFTCNSCGRKS